MIQNEDSRVKIPTLLHLCRLGYNYISLKDAVYDTNTNIFTNIFLESIQKINPEREEEIKRFYQDTLVSLENEDLGKSIL